MAFSQLQSLKNFKSDPAVVKAELANAKAHMKCCFELYEEAEERQILHA